MARSNEEDLLNILQAHGQNFLSSFSLPEAASSSKKRKQSTSQNPNKKVRKVRSSVHEESEEEEWGGITDEPKELHEILHQESGHVRDADFDDGSIGDKSTLHTNVTVFNDSSSDHARPSPVSKAQMRAFMSSKVSKVRQELPSIKKFGEPPVDKEDEYSNAQNDALLYRLVHTKLLSGSLNPEFDLTPAHRRKALAGRILELSGGAKLGKGEKSVRDEERNKAAKRVRDGITMKQKQRAKQELEEAKNAGNYHPTLKNLFETSATSSTKKRERGLKMGVGSFNGGLLRLSREEIGFGEGRRPSKDREHDNLYYARSHGSRGRRK